MIFPEPAPFWNFHAGNGFKEKNEATPTRTLISISVKRIEFSSCCRTIDLLGGHFLSQTWWYSCNFADFLSERKWQKQDQILKRKFWHKLTPSKLNSWDAKITRFEFNTSHFCPRILKLANMPNYLFCAGILHLFPIIFWNCKSRNLEIYFGHSIDSMRLKKLSEFGN